MSCGTALRASGHEDTRDTGVSSRLRALRVFVVIATFVSLPTAVAAQQAPSAERLTRFRSAAIEGQVGRALNVKVSALFGLPEELRIVEAAGMVLAIDGGKRVLSMAFATSTADVVIMESLERSIGTIVTVFHTDHVSFALRSTASGPTVNDLQLVSNDGAADKFKDILEIWDRALPAMLKARN